MQHKPLEFLYERFSEYIEDRRRSPRNDILTGLATATFPDGSTPEVERRGADRRQPVRRRPGDDGAAAVVRAPDARRAARPQQALVRDDRERIPNFIEETLRLESPLRTQFRMARVRDGPRRRRHPGRRHGDARPRRLQPRSPGVRAPARVRHRAGPTPASTSASGTASTPAPGHPSPGPRARSRSTGFLDRTSDIAIDEAHHGPAGGRRYEYLPTFFLRGLQQLHLEVTPAASPST